MLENSFFKFEFDASAHIQEKEDSLPVAKACSNHVLKGAMKGYFCPVLHNRSCTQIILSWCLKLVADLCHALKNLPP